jgi:hypothetical protein
MISLVAMRGVFSCGTFSHKAWFYVRSIDDACIVAGCRMHAEAIGPKRCDLCLMSVIYCMQEVFVKKGGVFFRADKSAALREAARLEKEAKKK